MSRVLLDKMVMTDYGQFDIVWSETSGFDGDFERFFAGQVNGLAGAVDPGGVYLHFARRSGGSEVRILLEDQEPDDPGTGYQDVVEVSVTIPEGATVAWQAWAAESWGALAGDMFGNYRLRVSAQNRDDGVKAGHSDGPVDAYLLEFWHDELRPDAILRVGSDNARYWHAEIGGNS